MDFYVLLFSERFIVIKLEYKGEKLLVWLIDIVDCRVLCSVDF